MSKSREQRRKEAEARNAIAQARSLEEKLDLAVQRGHSECREAVRLRKLIAERTDQQQPAAV